MTLDYRMRPPSEPGRAGLVTFGVISLVIAGFLLLGGLCSSIVTLSMIPRAGAGGPMLPGVSSVSTVTSVSAVTVSSGGPTSAPGTVVASTLPVTSSAAVNSVAVRYSVNGVTATSMPAGGFPALPRAAMLVSFFVMLVTVVMGGGLLAWFGLAMLRVRRWVRAWVVALSGWAVVTVAAAAPGVIVAALETSKAMPPGLGGGFVWIGVAVSYVFELGIPLAYFLFFVRAQTEAALVHYDGSPVWSDRWPLAPFCVMVAAGLQGVLGALGSVSMAMFPMVEMSGEGREITLVSNAGFSVVLVAVALLCYRRSRWAWRFGWVAIAVQAAGVVAMTMADVTYTMPGMQGPLAGKALRQPGVMMLVVPAAYGGVLWLCRRGFWEMSAPMASAVPTVGCADRV
jgi:hypothetical protein